MVASTPPPEPPQNSPVYDKISVSMPREMIIELKEIVGKGGVSQYITETIAERMRRDAMREWLREAEASGATYDEEYAAEIDAAFERAAESMRAEGSA